MRLQRAENPPALCGGLRGGRVAPAGGDGAEAERLPGAEETKRGVGARTRRMPVEGDWWGSAGCTSSALVPFLLWGRAPLLK